MNRRKNVLAIPPDDYEGSVADWIVALVSRGLMKEDDFYGDIIISQKDYIEILEECEKK